MKPKEIVVHDKNMNKQYAMPYGICIWATGVALHPLCEALIKKLPEKQKNTKALITGI